MRTQKGAFYFDVWACMTVAKFGAWDDQLTRKISGVIKVYKTNTHTPNRLSYSCGVETISQESNKCTNMNQHLASFYLRLRRKLKCKETLHVLLDIIDIIISTTTTKIQCIFDLIKYKCPYTVMYCDTHCKVYSLKCYTCKQK